MLGCALALAPLASAQFYEKVNLTQANSAMLRECLSGDQMGTGMFVAGLNGLEDPSLEPLFRAMTESDRPGARIYGVLGCALASKKGLDPALVAKLTAGDERAAIIREANISGILRDSPVDALLAQGNFSTAATLTLIGELDRRGGSWKPEQLRPITLDKDTVAAGVASLLLLSKGDATAWDAFQSRLTALPDQARSEALRALTEGSLVFEIKEACAPLLKLSTAPGTSDDAAIAAIGAALRLDTALGVAAWEERVAVRRSQAQLVRAGLQLLASQDRGVPASAFEKIRNGNAIVDAIADTGVALRSGGDPAEALIKLLDAGHPMSAEWALVRSSDLPPEQSAKIWKHLIERIDDADPASRPMPALVAGVARELMKSDIPAVKALAAKVRGSGSLEVAVLSGIYDSRKPEAVEIARAMRGQLPRAGDSLVVLLLARQGAPLSEDEMDLLGRAGGGGGDLDAVRQTQAAWLYLKRKSGTPAQAISIIQGGAPAQAPAPSGGSAPASNPAPTSNPAAPGGPAPAGTPAPAGNSGASAPPKRTP